jgi:hypothetical protein
MTTLLPKHVAVLSFAMMVSADNLVMYIQIQ